MSQLTAKELAASLTVKDLAASIAFYTDILGFDLVNRHEREGKLVAASMRAGDVRILLAQDDGAKGLDREKGIGFSLQITTTDDIDALATRIKNAGGQLEGDPQTMPWGPRMFRLRDPDGFRFTFSS